MALKVELKPGERFLLGTCVITNGGSRTRLTIEGDLPILREKDVLTARTADTPAKRIHLAIQLMYLTRDPAVALAEYTTLMREFLEAVPSAAGQLSIIDNAVLTGEYYRGLRAAQALIALEGDLLKHANRSTGIRLDGAEDGGSAGA